MKSTIFLIVLFLGVVILNTFRNDSRSKSTSNPDRIMLSIPGDPATTRAVTWRTIKGDSKSLGEIALLNSTPSQEDSATIVTGTNSPWEEGSSLAMGHKVIFEGLKPNTKYAYRVGDGEDWSEWFQFKTSAQNTERFSFLYFGDVQNDIKMFGSRAIRQAYSHFPNADFMLFAGDLIDKSIEEEWGEFFYAGNWIFGTIPSLATPGNHEYYPNDDGPRTFSNQWNQIFVNPDNHPENLKNRTYFIDYQGARFISLDSPAMGYRDEDRSKSVEWLKRILAENPNKWTIIFTHYPIYACSQGRDNEMYRDAVKPILENYGVDLVLQGHDHTYCRGQNLENVGENCANPPMYMVSVSGPKMYGLATSFWSDRVASGTQLYQHISVNDDVIHVQSFTIAGELYDDFQLVKNDSGINTVIESEEIAKINQRVEIPDRAMGKYTEDELKKYKLKFSMK